MSHIEKEPSFEKPSLREIWEKLPPEIKKLIPEENLGYYNGTNEMHCDLSMPGGSKFLEAGTIFDVLEGNEQIAKLVEKRDDHREALLRAGADEAAFLPATKGGDDPEGLPEALYYMIENVKGKLGIIQLKELDPNTQVVIRREKSMKNEQGEEQVPCSFSVIKENMNEMPDTDFATVIIGRKGGKEGKDELWTIHPGIPVRPAQGDFIEGSEKLQGPEDGVRQEVMISTVEDLLKSGHMKEDDYVKIIIGDKKEVLSKYEIM